MDTQALARARKDYNRGQLLEENTPSTPLPLFDAWMGDALAAGLEDATTMALATCIGNRPSCRIVLLKGAVDGAFAFYTGYTSRKGQEIEANPQAAATFFWPGLERQIRLEGTVRRVSRSQSEAYFRSRPLESQISAAISPQSQPVPSRQYLEELKRQAETDLHDQPPSLPEDWGGYELLADRIEFWQGGPGRLHDRILYEKSGSTWVKSRLAP